MSSNLQTWLLLSLIPVFSANLILQRISSYEFLSETDAAINIIKMCFPEEAKRSTVLAGSFKNFDQRLISSLAPVVMLDNPLKKLDNIYKLHIFIISIQPDLNENIKNLKNSLWWNHDGFFIIFGESLLYHYGTCNNVSEILLTTWKMDILNAILICSDSENEVMIYTFNPYSHRAPQPWKEVYYKNLPSGDPWIIYNQRYSPNSFQCISVNFDKTLSLDGYQSTSVGNHEIKLARTSPVKKLILEKLNISSAYKNIHTTPLRIDVTNTTSNSDAAELLINGTIDILLIPNFLTDKKDIVQSEIFIESGYTAISQYRGKKSIAGMIFELFGWWLIIAMFVVSAITVFMFKMSLKMDIDRAILEIIRMWANSGFLKRPIDAPSRIYLFGIFLFALIMTSVFQGKILGFQTHPTSIKNIETIQDLLSIKDGKIYAAPTVFNRFFHELQHLYRPIKNFHECPKYVLNDEKSVCLSGVLMLEDQASKYNLHVSKKLLIKNYLVFAMRKDWPLIKRVNSILKMYLEHQPIGRYNLTKTYDQSQDPRPLKLRDFYFAFAFLAIGLILSTVCFIIELAWIKKKSIYFTCH